MKIRFLWRGKIEHSARRMFGLGGVHRDGATGELSLLVQVRRIVIALIAAGALAYFGGGTALYLWWNRDPHNEVRLADVLLPTRWSTLREKRGATYLADGLVDVKAGRIRDAYMRLQIGLARHPANLPARLALAQIDTAINRPQEGLELMIRGLDFERPDRSYLDTLFRMASQMEDTAAIVAVCDHELARTGVSAEEALQLREEKCGALIHAQDYAEVLRLTEPPDRIASAALAELRVLALLGLKQTAPAVDFLEKWDARTPDDPQVLRLMARAYREAGRRAELDRALDRLCALTPALPDPYAYGVVQRRLAGDRAGADAALGDYFLRFNSVPGNLYLIAEGLAEIPAPAMVARCVEQAREHGFQVVDFLLLEAQARALAGETAAAQTALAQLAPLTAKAGPFVAFQADLLGRTLAAANGGTGGATLDLLDFCRKHQVPLGSFKLMITTLRQAGQPAAAAGVLAQAVSIYPHSSVLERWGPELQATLAAAKTAPPVVAHAPAGPDYATMPADEFFRQLDGLTAARDWNAAELMLRQARLASPGWLADRGGDLSWRQLLIATGLRDGPTVQLAAQQYLDGSADHAFRVLRVAQDAARAGDTDDATLLARAVLQSRPDATAAQTLLDQLQRPVAPVKTPAATKTGG